MASGTHLLKNAKSLPCFAEAPSEAEEEVEGALRFEMWDLSRKMKAYSTGMDLYFEQGPTFRTPRKMGHPKIENKVSS